MISFMVYVLFITIADSSPTAKVSEDVGIINGELIEIEDAPYQVALLKNGESQCGGTIVEKNIIITAAHCVKGSSSGKYSIRAGSKFIDEGGKLIAVEKYIAHENFNFSALSSDIAVLKLSEPLEFSASIQKVAMFATGEQIKDGETGIVSGWGLTEKNVYPKDLRRTHVKKVNKKDCDEAYKPLVVPKDALCASAHKTGACYGDSGGPLLFQGKLGGVVSFGSGEEGCASEKYPDAYADVSILRPWVDQKINELLRGSD